MIGERGPPMMRIFGMNLPIKYVALLTLIIQNTSLVLVLKYSRTVEGPMYIASTAVLVGEIVKTIICISVLFYEKEMDLGAVVQILRDEIVGKSTETLKVAVPASLFTFQNNILYVAISNLDAATFQVSYQLKVLTTALFSVALLGKQLDRAKWASFVILMIGVALVQWPSDANKKTNEGANVLVGLSAVLFACISSGFAGVYFEKVLKGGSTSVWIRNIQMSIWSILFGCIVTWISDGQKISEGGFFQGYNAVVYLVIMLQAGGGILVALVVKYADNILKGFATSVSIVLSTILSMYFFNFVATFQFCIGATLVIASVYLYSKP